MKLRTDLAVENKEMYDEDNDVEIKGVEVETDSIGNLNIVRIKIKDDHGSKIMEKPIGNYITIEIPDITNSNEELKKFCSAALLGELKKLIPKTKNLQTIVIGLGNEKITPDALGPVTAKKIMATRHYFMEYENAEDMGLSCVSVIIPGVMGETGIESAEIIKGVVDATDPHVIVVIDALAARNMDRVNTTIQISDAGINPGAGMENHRMTLNEDTMGVKVIAIGVPTVIDSAAIVYDTLVEYGNEKPEKANNFIKKISKKLMVTSSNIDCIVEDFSIIISNAINLTLHEDYYSKKTLSKM